MRVFTFISKQGDALPLAQRVVEEGHRAVFYINEDKRRRIGNGLIEKSAVHETLIDDDGVVDNSVLRNVLHPRPDCVVMDMVGKGYGRLAEGIRKKGIAVIGGSAFGDQVELDRPYGAKVMKLMGINSPKTAVFKDYPKAIEYVKQTNKPYVYKPSGNMPTSTTYVAQTPEDLIGMLDYYSDIKEEFELQEKVDGIEVSTELWYNGKEVLNVNHTFEEKALCNGGVGPKTGAMGSVVWNSSEATRLYKEGIGKIVPALKRHNYRGPIDLNTIVSKDKLYGLEFTARFGYDALFDFLELYKGRIGDLLYGVASGVARHISMRTGWALGLTIALPPFPLTDVEDEYSQDILLQGINSQNLKHLWFYDVYKKKGEYACAGNGGNLGVVSARGETIREARRRAYRTLGNLVIPDVIYRTDIGERAPSDHAQLRDWGWI